MVLEYDHGYARSSFVLVLDERTLCDRGGDLLRSYEDSLLRNCLNTESKNCSGIYNDNDYDGTVLTPIGRKISAS